MTNRSPMEVMGIVDEAVKQASASLHGVALDVVVSMIRVKATTIALQRLQVHGPPPLSLYVAIEARLGVEIAEKALNRHG